jgi:predicted acyltransferase
MNIMSKNMASLPAGRVASVDFFRGLTMFLLIGESTHLYRHLRSVEDSNIVGFFATQLSHHQWHGMYFWDLIQPFFMFIVGVAIPFAVANRLKKGDSNRLITLHALKRSLLLLLFGWAISCISQGAIVYRFANVLAQLSVTYLVAFLIMKKSFSFQLILSLLLLLLTDLAYRFFPLEGFNEPWVAFHNLGAWVNNQIEGMETKVIWASMNAIPTTAHTIWGVLCGKLLMSERSAAHKIRIMVIAGAIALAAGYGLDLTGTTPIIKKIATASFVLASGGWTILALALCYWLIDVKQLAPQFSRFFIIVGTNCIFIYLFFQIGGADLLTSVFSPFIKGLFSWSGEFSISILISLTVWASIWYLSYWLFKNRLFIKI